jgi:hypothetical protein
MPREKVEIKLDSDYNNQELTFPEITGFKRRLLRVLFVVPGIVFFPLIWVYGFFSWLIYGKYIFGPTEKYLFFISE